MGLHAKRIYYKFIEDEVFRKTLSFFILVELQSKKKDIDKFFKNKSVRPKFIFFVPDKDQISPKKIDRILKKIKSHNKRVKDRFCYHIN